ncbi:SO_0444 family Cu/Zn efflux transporter [Candidatus Electronema sp. TJ]|uniref:SO_0444 family Cu/Zn efflux transporter n=1 Tax=Candidatus Electronema sp. TJ TaxID=3401573 RepID=UPI003AA9ABF4
MLSFLAEVVNASWQLLNQAAFYILFGLLVGGLLKTFLSPAYVAEHLGKGRFSSVFKAALLGIPIPLCSCGVLPAAATLKKQGANNGAVTAFLISTPESGIDSITMSWALLDPIMTVARPVSAFISAAVAGLLENFISFKPSKAEPQAALPPFRMAGAAASAAPAQQPGFAAKLKAGVQYMVNDLWPDIMGWFFIGIIAGGIITALVPDEIFSTWLGGGFYSMLLMLAVGIPLYICASASTPIAAAFILKGASPGTALVFLLAGPATNITSLTVLIGILGKRATGLFLLSIAVVSVLCGLAVDAVYLSLGIKAAATIGHHGAMLPHEVMLAAVVVLFALSVRPLLNSLQRRFGKTEAKKSSCCGTQPEQEEKSSCGCGGKHNTCC